MIAYAIIMIIVSLLFLVVGILIYKGNTNLIHDYHMFNIKEDEKREYGREISIGIFVIAGSCLVSGITGFFSNSPLVSAELFIGLITALIIIVKVQKKYNSGIF